MEHIHEQGGVSVANFLFVGEHAALDFANTLLNANGAPMETLATCDDLLQWLVLAKLIPAQEKAALAVGLASPEKGERLLEKIRMLRGLWKNNLERLAAGYALSADLLKLVNQLLSEDHAWQVLTQETRTRTFGLHGVHVPLEAAKKISSVIAGQIAQFLASANLQYLRHCAGPDCVVYFYDTTKSHRRQWCSMAICGNRHKVAKFRSKENRVRS